MSITNKALRDMYDEDCEMMDLISRMDEKKEMLIGFMNYVQTKQAIYFIDKEELAVEYLKK